MSQYSGSYAPGDTDQTQTSRTDVAREETAGVSQAAQDAGRHVAATATDQAKQVAGETRQQARDLMSEAADQARQQASAQQQKTAGQLRTLAGELQDMAARSSEPGLGADLARQAAGRISDAAAWLDHREPGDLLEEVRAFARRRPGVFLAGAAVAGLAAGRLTRGLTASQGSGNGGSPGTPGGPYDPADAGVPSPELATGYPATGYPTTGYPPAAGDPAADAAPASPAYPPATGQPVVPGPAIPYPADIGTEPGYGTVPEPGYGTAPGSAGQDTERIPPGNGYPGEAPDVTRRGSS